MFQNPLRSLLPLLGSALLALPASAQCPMPDGLDGGPCCTSTSLKLPALPKIKQEIWDLCWKDCDIAFQDICIARWTSPNKGTTSSRCGPMRSKLVLKDTAGSVKWRGAMRVVYSRTWIEFTSAGNQVQVWRFLVNGDLRATQAAGPIPCPVAPCAPAHNNRVHYSGYIDYAFDCATNQFENAVWMLTHACDPFSHNPAFPRGGAFHPDFSYTFVGPAFQFSPSPLVATEGGGGPFEAVRRRTIYPPGSTGVTDCEYEERIQQHDLLPQQQMCLCSPQTQTPQWMIADLFISGGCGTMVTTAFPSSYLPGYLSMGIGTWSAPGVYPGVEDLRWNVGDYEYQDPCTGTVREEVFFGVTTLGGWDAIQVTSQGPGMTLPLTFIDQANSLRPPATKMNEPYVSDHIINLNH